VNQLKDRKDNRFNQSNREVLITLLLSIGYFLWWYIFAYGLGEKPFESYKYVLGLPAWFFYSCVIGAILFSLITWFVVKKFFVDMPLDEDSNLKNEN